jgi:hypothetical protein
MAVNLTTKFSPKVDERFKLKSLTDAGVNQEYEWEGANVVKVYSIPTVAMGDYTRTGLSRYGTATELQDTVATYTITRDRAFTYTIDKGNKIDTADGVRDSQKALARQHDEVIAPEIDIYRLAAYVTAAAANSARPVAANITASNAYASFLTGNAFLDNKKVPQVGRFAYVTPTYYNFIKQDPSFLKASDSGMAKLNSGHVGDIDGVAIIKVPATYFPTKTPFIITHKSVMCSPMKLKDYKVHQDPPGISGQLTEGRVIYDAFVLEAKKDGIYAWLEV